MLLKKPMMRKCIGETLNCLSRVRILRQNVKADLKLLKKWARTAQSTTPDSQETLVHVNTEFAVGAASVEEFEAMKTHLLSSFQTYMPPDVSSTCTEWDGREGKVVEMFLQ